MAFLIGAARFASANVHWIQALHPANKLAVARQSWCGQIVIIERTGVDVLVNDQYAIVWVGSFCFSVQSDSGEPLGPCAQCHQTILQRQ